MNVNTVDTLLWHIDDWHWPSFLKYATWLACNTFITFFAWVLVKGCPPRCGVFTELLIMQKNTSTETATASRNSISVLERCQLLLTGTIRRSFGDGGQKKKILSKEEPVLLVRGFQLVPWNTLSVCSSLKLLNVFVRFSSIRVFLLCRQFFHYYFFVR